MWDTFEELIIHLAFTLQKCPFIIVERLAMMGYRKLSVKSYIIFFTIVESSKVINVERISIAKFKMISYHVMLTR